ncbi:MAG: pyridoxal-phosphate dependent enzyme [Microscillaceae bacterium]|nr:pyridoxal-phosphate dependent enzyme [Microscillaceae bacterium]MDW8461093.1 pyridoxal-phosphate dependent enzyme [Cytophagales bacterium]
MFFETQLLASDWLAQKKVQIWVMRIDKIHPQISGNKWFKLKYNLQEARTLGFDTLLTFGGAYSNHIYATAAAGKIFGFQTISIIRGEKTLPLNETLTFAQAQGMKLDYVSREQYRQKNEPYFIRQLQEKWGRFYLIPEGGSNALAVKGCAEILQNCPIDFDFICLPCGTGGTLAGVSLALSPHQRALGFAVLKNAQFLYKEVVKLQQEAAQIHTQNYHIFLDYHLGGYAKIPLFLQSFCNLFTNTFSIPIEPIYTGKMFLGIWDLISKDFFAPYTQIVALHTGGMRLSS